LEDVGESSAGRDRSPRRARSKEGFRGQSRQTQRATVNTDTEDQQRDKENDDVKLCEYLIHVKLFKTFLR
jgi:hypothetical protein